MDIPITNPADRTIPLFRNWHIRGGVIVDEFIWRQELINCEYFDCITYTANGDAADKCHKVLASRIYGQFKSTTKVRLAKNVHTKLYIIHTDEVDVWVGSRNLVRADSYHNVMVRINDERQVETLLLYFKRIWSLAKPLLKKDGIPSAHTFSPNERWACSTVNKP